MRLRFPSFTTVFLRLKISVSSGMRKRTNDDLRKQRMVRSDGSKAPVSVILDNIRSLYNVGSIFRTSDGAGIAKVVLTGYTPVPPRKEIEKTALGSTQTVSWEYVEDPVEAVQSFKKTGVKVLALERTDTSAVYTSLSAADFPVCLVIGNEVAGVSADVLAQCDGSLEIPMAGLKHSLNVAVAYGIAVFELVRVWRAHHASKDRV